MSPLRSPLVIMAVAIALRAGWALSVPVHPISDSLAYDTLAQNLALGNGYGWTAAEPTAFWAPGTAMVYALLYRTFGHSFVPVTILNVLLGVWVIAAAMWLGKEWFGQRVGLITGWLLACWPQLVQFTTLLASELLFVAAVLAALVLWERARVWWIVSILLGVTSAIAAYVRPLGLVLPFLLLILDESRAERRRYSVLSLLVSLTVMLVLIAPWSVRNKQVFGKFVLLATDAGYVLLDGLTQTPFIGTGQMPERPQEYNEAQYDAYAVTLALDWMRANPLSYIGSIFIRFGYMLSRESIGVVWNAGGLARFGEGALQVLKIWNAVYWFGVLTAATVGATLLGRNKGWRVLVFHPTMVMTFGLLLPVAMLSAQDRYHVPVAPFVAMLAAYGADEFANGWRTRNNLSTAS